MANPGAGLGFESHALRFAEGYFPVFGPLPFRKTYLREPQGLKPSPVRFGCGTAEAVPFVLSFRGNQEPYSSGVGHPAHRGDGPNA